MGLADFTNGAFEFLGSVALWRNIWALHKDKHVAGVRWYTTAFFALWGYWNLYYYPSLGQWLSFAGGISITVANTIWMLQMLYYTKLDKQETLCYNASTKEINVKDSL